MKVDVKKIDTLKRELKFEIPKERVAQALDKVYQEIGKYAKVKGFRPGKVPRHILQVHHGKLAQEETIKKLVPEVYQEGIDKEKIQPIDLPEIRDVHYQDGRITFTALLDIRPEININDYKGISISRKPSHVTDEDVNKTLEYLSKGQGKDQNVTLDDAFARSLGFPTLEEFKKSLSRQLELEKDRQNRIDIENQIAEALLKKTKFNVPESLIKRQLERRLQDVKHRLQHQGMAEEEINKKIEEMRKELEASTEKDVRLYLIFDKIAQLENMEIKEGENLPAKVIEFLLKEGKWEAK
jgi:FKBP-type peptidyl-prolyl cis-trans isomerase (trigger factor)